jgi:hypothetical protein
VIVEGFRGFGGPGRDRTDDLFHAMEARSQLRHRPTCEDTTLLVLGTSFILADSRKIVNASPDFKRLLLSRTRRDTKEISGSRHFFRFFHRVFLA